MKTLPEPADPGRAGPVAARHGPLSLLVIAIPALIGVVRILVSLRRPFLAGGDAAFIELAIRQALGGRQLLGPYSRFGWRHPGPILFYLFAPLYWLSGERSRSMFLSAWLVNLGCAIAIVVLVRRRLGEGAARVTAACLVVFCVATGFEPLINPWNPSLLAFPFLLLVFLAGAAAAGSVRSLLGALVVGSYLIQTHLAMLPVVGVTVGLAAAAWIVVARRTPGGPALDRRMAVIGLVGLGILWAGPVTDQLTRDPGNARAIAGFFRNPPTGLSHGHPVGDALTAVANEATRPFLGEVQGLHHAPGGQAPGAGGGGRALALVGTGLLGLVVAAAGRTRSPFAARLGALGAVNLIVAVAATTRAIGDLEPYLFFWTPALLLPPLVAAALAAFDGATRLAARRAPDGRRARLLATVGAAAMIVVGALLVDTTVHHATVSYADSPDAAPAAELIEAHVGHDRERVFRIHVIDGHFQTSSLLLRLVLDGYRFRMSPSYGLYTGSTGRRPDDGAPIIVVGTAASPTRPASTPLGTVGPFILSTVTSLD